jgi:hypothetical protein
MNGAGNKWSERTLFYRDFVLFTIVPYNPFFPSSTHKVVHFLFTVLRNHLAFLIALPVTETVLLHEPFL